MPVWKLAVSLGADTAFARDRVVMTPHFNDAGATTDPDSLCEDLATALAAFFTPAREITVKAYDAQGTVPVYPEGNAIRSTGVFPASDAPREVALCLSYYSERNIARQRGRLYLPVFAMGIGTGAARPSGPNLAKVMSLGPILEQLGGIDVDWCVYSRLQNVARPVTNYWCDDEWDTVRSRGLRATTRQLATTSEA